MIDVTYGITEETYTVGTASRTSYGIAAYENEKADGTASIVAAVHDITDNREKLVLFIQKCNECKLSSVHLQDAVEDFLAT